MKNLSKRELEAYCGDLSQAFGIQECVLEGGKAKGTKAYIVNNGCGLEMTVLADKCFAIPKMSFKGDNVGFISKTGICAPEFFQEEGTRGFLRNFEAGFLTTCGLTYVGTPGVEDGQPNGLHGVISNTPIEHASSIVEWDGDKAWLVLNGHAREGYLFGPNLEIRRDIRMNTKENKLWIHDEVENHGFDTQPLMLLYHFNMGYPMLDGSCKVYTNYDKIVPRDPHSAEGMEDCEQFLDPIDGYEEKVYFRSVSDESVKKGYVLLHNENLQKAVLIHLDPEALPVLNQWNSPRSGDYALGLEPGTAHVGGRIRAKEDGSLKYIEPGEVKTFDIEVEFIDCTTENEKLSAFIK